MLHWNYKEFIESLQVTCETTIIVLAIKNLDMYRKYVSKKPNSNCSVCGGTGEAETERHEGLVSCWKCFPD